MKTINTYINEKLRLTNKRKYTCQPITTKELRSIIIDRIEKEGSDCDLNDIDVSKIKDMSYLFNANGQFRQGRPISITFNCDISLWDVSNVEDMKYMFYGCKKFNQDLNSWDVSKVKDMTYMFFGCDSFNGDISKWNVSNVEYMTWMFFGCQQFNQDLNKWNVSNIKDMTNAFDPDYPAIPTWYDVDKWTDYDLEQ